MGNETSRITQINISDVDFDMVNQDMELDEPVTVEDYVKNHLYKLDRDEFAYNHFEDRMLLHDVFVMIELERARVKCTKCTVRMYDTTLNKGVPEKVIYYQDDARIAEIYAVADVLKRFTKPCNIAFYTPQEYMLMTYIVHANGDENALKNYPSSVGESIRLIRNSLQKHNYMFSGLNRIY